MKLTEEQINRYSGLFGQLPSVVVAIAAMYDNLKDVEKNLYLLGEENLPEDNEDDQENEENEDFEIEFDEEELDDELKDELKTIMPKLKKYASEKLGLTPDEIKKIKPIAIRKEIYNHTCPFNKEQQDKIDCNFCPLNTKNFVPLSFKIANELNISIEEAVEHIKLRTYGNPNVVFKKIMIDQENAKENDTYD